MAQLLSIVTSGHNVLKLFTSIIDKPFQISLFCEYGQSGATGALKGATFVKAPANIRLGTQAYYEHSQITDVKSVKILVPDS
jgi:hypothetical protein